MTSKRFTSALLALTALTSLEATVSADEHISLATAISVGNEIGGTSLILETWSDLELENGFHAEAGAQATLGVWFLGLTPVANGSITAEVDPADGAHVSSEFEIMGLTLFEHDFGAAPHVDVDLGTYYPVPSGLRVGISFGPVFFGIEGNIGVTSRAVMSMVADPVLGSLSAQSGLNVGGIGYASCCIDLFIVQAGIRVTLQFGTVGVFGGTSVTEQDVQGDFLLAMTAIDISLELYIRFGFSIFSWEESLELFDWSSQAVVLAHQVF